MKLAAFFETMNMVITLGLITFVGILLSIGIKKYIDLIREHLQTDELSNNRLTLERIVVRGEFDQVRKLKRRHLLTLRNHLADWAVDLSGDAFNRATKLYQELGFHRSDVKYLKNINVNKRMRAINRLEKLKLEIPFELNIKLINDNDPTIRMLAMILLINHHKKKATPYLISFIEQGKYGEKGFLFYILQELGKSDRKAISFIFERIADPDFEEALLISASMTPPMHFDEIIYRKLTLKSAPFVIVWALKVLMHFPSEKFLALLKNLRKHDFWAVRLQVARSLSIFHEDEVAIFLPDFLLDSNYLVRLAAAKETLLFRKTFSALIIKILENHHHPSQNIFKYLLSLEGDPDHILEQAKIIPLPTAVKSLPEEKKAA